MAKKEKTLYAPGELKQTRERLGNLDDAEARRMSQLLGGEVGYERSKDQETARNKPSRVRNETVEVMVGGGRKPLRRIETAEMDDGTAGPALSKKAAAKKEKDSSDDPSVPVKSTYWERIKIDRYAGQLEFEIKSPAQVMVSVLSLFSEPPDLVSPAFVNKRMNEYYKRIELLVTSVRTLLPRNNLKRNERLKKASPFAFSILDAIRYWNIDQLAANLTRLQSHPRNVKTADFTEILRDIYRPLYILEKLDPDTHIKGSFKLLYKVLYLENPGEAKVKFQEHIRNALSSFNIIRRDIHFQLYPMLLKLLSHCWIPYEKFFLERKNRIQAFLQLTEKIRISPNMENTAEAEDVAEQAEEAEEAAEQAEEADPKTEEVFEESNMDEALTEEERAKKQVRESEEKALARGLSTLEALFPKAGWERLSTFPDMYPYFFDVFKFKKGIELIAPTDPLQQTLVLMRILEELFFALRYVSFGIIPGPDGTPERIDTAMTQIINNWQKNAETSIEKEYLPRLDEYCSLLENSAESRTSNYAKRLLNELHWTKRLYFFPYYKFESIMAPPFQKNTATTVYSEVRLLRRYLSAVAAGIEQGNRQGGAEKRAPCDGIDNPWDPYAFQVPNPLSIRLDALLAPKRRNNASLIFFTLTVTVTLDYLLNNEKSWAYGERTGFLFRSENGEGVRPLFGVDTKIDAEAIFKLALKKRQIAAAQAAAAAKTPDINV
jgi:hypothetical protein